MLSGEFGIGNSELGVKSFKFRTPHSAFRNSHNERGAFLIAMAAILGIVCGITAWSSLFVAMTEARHAKVFREHSSSRYLAEAGLMIAREKLWTNPAYCGGNEIIDLDGDGILEASDATVTVTVSDCGAGNPHQLSVQINY